MPYSSTRVRELLARGRRRGGGRAARPPARGARAGRARRPARAASSASRPPTSRSPSGSACPADGVYAGTFVGADGVERPAAISLGRRPTFYADAGHARCSRRTCSTSTATSTASAPGVRVPRTASGARSASTRVDALVAQMHRDVAATRRARSRLSPAPPRRRTGRLVASWPIRTESVPEREGFERAHARQDRNDHRAPRSTTPTPARPRCRSRSSPSASTT